jgi:hypothetical protein
MESRMTPTCHVRFGERGRETRLVQARQVRSAPTPCSPLLSNILLTPFDREMRRRGYQLTRDADDWVITCRSRREAEAARRCAEKILATLGVRVNPQKTRIVHVRQGFACLG